MFDDGLCGVWVMFEGWMVCLCMFELFVGMFFVFKVLLRE